MARIEYYRAGGSAPAASDFVPAAFALVRNADGAVLLVRRADDGYWELPGGRLDLGESASEALVREVAEETGIAIKPCALSGVYSEASHILAYPDGRVSQQIAMCFLAVATEAHTPRADGVETTAAAWYAPDEIEGLQIHPAVRRRINDALTQPDVTHFD